MAKVIRKRPRGIGGKNIYCKVTRSPHAFKLSADGTTYVCIDCGRKVNHGGVQEQSNG